jgi:hypothetical protein
VCVCVRERERGEGECVCVSKGVCSVYCSVSVQAVSQCVICIIELSSLFLLLNHNCLLNVLQLFVFISFIFLIFSISISISIFFSASKVLHIFIILIFTFYFLLLLFPFFSIISDGTCTINPLLPGMKKQSRMFCFE